MLMQDQLIGSISFHGDTVRIDGLSSSDTELCDYLIAIPPDDQASSLAHLIEIGLACLHFSGTSLMGVPIRREGAECFLE